MFNVNPVDEKTRKDAVGLVTEHWGSPVIVSRGKIHSAASLPGFAAFENDELKGLITYNIENGACEIVSIDSLTENRGLGSMLIDRVVEKAGELGCRRVWLITTDDNTHAMRFFQKRCFDLAGLHINAVRESRKIKPQIPLLGNDDIPIMHEIEFERILEIKGD